VPLAEAVGLEVREEALALQVEPDRPPGRPVVEGMSETEVASVFTISWGDQSRRVGVCLRHAG
jgi:hypothetical protein